MSSSASSRDSTAPRLVSILPPRSLPGSRVHHRRGEQAGGVERLQQVVAGGGDEAGLAEVGGLGLGAARLKLGGTLDHALLQRLGRLAELACRFRAAPRRCARAPSRRCRWRRSRRGQRIEPELDDAPPRVAISCVCGVSGRRSRSTISGVAPNHSGEAPTATASPSSDSSVVKRSLKISRFPSRSKAAIPMPTWSSVLRRIS